MYKCQAAKSKSTDARKHLFAQKSGSLWNTPDSSNADIENLNQALIPDPQLPYTE